MAISLSIMDNYIPLLFVDVIFIPLTMAMLRLVKLIFNLYEIYILPYAV